MYDTLQSCDALWKVRTRRPQSVFWRCEHADEGGSNPRMWHLGSVCRARSPHSCELCLGHPVRSPQSALAVRIPTLPLRRPRPQSAVRGGPWHLPWGTTEQVRTDELTSLLPLRPQAPLPKRNSDITGVHYFTAVLRSTSVNFFSILTQIIHTSKKRTYSCITAPV